MRSKSYVTSPEARVWPTSRKDILMKTIKELVRCGHFNRARCSGDTYLDEVIDMMAQLKESAVLVTKSDGSVAGILTDSDILCAVKLKGTAGSSICREKVKDWMRSTIAFCRTSDLLTTAENLMAQHSVRHLVLQDGNRLIGSVTRHDILAKIHEQDQAELELVKANLIESLNSQAA